MATRIRTWPRMDSPRNRMMTTGVWSLRPGVGSEALRNRLVEDYDVAPRCRHASNHCIADGIALIAVMQSLVDGGAAPPAALALMPGDSVSRLKGVPGQRNAVAWVNRSRWTRSRPQARPWAARSTT